MRRNNAIVKKMMLALLGLVMSVIAGGAICTEGTQVMAAELDEAYNDATYKDFLTVEHTKNTAMEKIEAKTAPAPQTTTACKDWLFAGWYTDVKCTTPIRTAADATEPSYAKFVPTDVLSVKCQVLAETDANSENTNLRFTTSIDTDQYYRVGFEISRPGTTYTPYETSDAFKRIEASEEAGVAFKYSPKVINTKSEAFVTYTITGIPNTEENRYFDTVFMAKPYWKTLDGTKVYGVTRYVKVSDFYNSVVNIPVKVEKADSYTSADFAVKKYTNATTVAGSVTEGVAVRYNAQENYATVSLSGQGTLASATKYTVSHEGDTTTYIQRNLTTKYTGSGTADSSWYDVDSSANEFVIATSADLYGFTTVVNNNDSFTNTKFYLVADIEVNKGKAGVTGWDKTKKANGEAFGENETGTEYPWTSIAISGHNFKAIFDGQGHTISGIIGTQGFFQYLQGGRVKNFQLTNSYFAPTGNYAGSVVARAYGGYIEDVHSEAFINSSKIITGGIVGGLVNNYTLNITNCCYAGTFSTASGGCAGILGKVENTGANANITGCQFLGQLTTTTSEAGGFVGTNAGVVTITNSLSDGTVNASGTSKKYIGGFIGQSAGSKSTITNSMFSGTVNTADTCTGGFIGYNKSTTEAKIENCLFDGTIKIDSAATGTRNVGGFVGLNETKLSVITSLNSGTIVYDGTAAIYGVCRVVGQNTSVDMHLNKVYSTIEGFNASTSQYTPNTVTLTNTQKYSAIDESNLVNTQAYFNTELFEGDTTKWALVEGSTPVLKTFIGTATELALPQVPEKADISWYGGVASTYTICDDEEDDNATKVKKLRGFSYLVGEGITFAGKTVNLGSNVILNDTGCTTDEEWTEYLKNNTPEEWIPVGTGENEFAGTFDGGMNTIKGIYINNTSQTGVAFFLSTAQGSSVQNLRIEDSYIYSTQECCGSVVGCSSGNIINVYSNAVVKTINHNAGGIVGRVWVASSSDNEIEIINCWFDGEVDITSKNNAGGIVGFITSGYVKIENCLNSGKIDHKGTNYGWIGGICGRTMPEVTKKIGPGECESPDVYVQMIQCLNTGKVNDSTANSIGSILGKKQNRLNDEGTKMLDWSKVYVDSVYATTDSFSVASGSSFDQLDSNNKKNVISVEASVITGYEVTGDVFAPLTSGEWIVTDKTPVPVVFADYVATIATAWYDGSSSPYTLTTAAELRGFSHLVSTGTDFVGETVELGKDINLSPNWIASKEGRPGNAWSPIGNETNKFAGTFDGNGKTIIGLYVDSSDYEFIGLFGVTAIGSEITDFRITNSYLKNKSTSSGYVGSVVGKLCGDMSEVYSNATVTSNNLRSAGMVAYAEGDEVNISDCWFDGQVLEGDKGDNRGRYIGGIVSSVRKGVCNISNTLFTGEIRTNHTTKGLYVGGIVGETYPADTSVTLELDSVVSAGEISGNHNHVACYSVLGQAQAKIVDNETESARAIVPSIVFNNVFATRECYPTTYAIQTVTYKDVNGNEYKVQGTRTGDVLVTTGQDRFIGYGTQEATNSDGSTYALTFSDAAWSMRRNDVPIPTCFKDVLKDGSVIATASLSETTLADEIGLGYLPENKDIKDALAYGAGNYVVTYSDIVDTTYTEYLKELDALKFKEYANNKETEMYQDGVKSATYFKDYVKDGSSEWVLNITYVEKLSKLYISINTDKKSLDDNLLKNTESVDKKNDISLSMLKIFGTDENGNNNGNSFVFQLPNGHFIVNDGGRMSKDAATDDATQLVAYLKELAGEDEIVIDAWIVTHFHGDHWGLMESFFTHKDLRNQVYVESVYLCEPSVYALDYWEEQYKLTRDRFRGIRTLMKQDGSTPPDIYQMHMGQRYYFAGMTMDVLDTQEQHHVEEWGANDTADKFNTSSTNCIFTFKDASQETKKVLIGGDATNVNMYYMINAYGQNNKAFSNISVLAAYHHGHNTTSYYVEDQKIDHIYRIQYIGTEDWSNFLINNTNNVKRDDKVFDVILFPYRAVYKMTKGHTSDKGYRYYGDDGEYNFAYNIGTINQTFIDNAKTYATYATDNVIITFGKNLKVNGVEY